MSKSSLIAVAVLVVVLAIAGFFMAQRPADDGAEAPLTQGMPVPGPEGAGVEEAVVVPSVTISATAEGFVPASVTVKKGTVVVFRNDGATSVWPASAMHPTHKVYPGSDIAKCGTAEAGMMFDACAGIAPGGTWSFMFNETGTWKYHDHLNVRHFGSVTVE